MATNLTDLVPVNPDGTSDAIAFSRACTADGMRAAREHAGLTQEELAARIRRPVEKVAKIESAEWKPSDGHIRQVLYACGLPDDWVPPG